MNGWLHIARGDAPLVVTVPHAGTDLAGLDARFVSPWLARKDADWWVDELYSFARAMGVTLIRTAISRSVIDVNRDPSGTSLYPGMTTTGLCPEETFDGEALYCGSVPDGAEIAERREEYFAPYHAAIAAELTRLRALHPRVVLYDAHSIRSRVPRLFDGDLPHFNIGTNSGKSCDPALSDSVAEICATTGADWVVDGRFKGGWTTRHYGRPDAGHHAIQMELAQSLYLEEPGHSSPENWPAPLDPVKVAALRPVLAAVLTACIAFALD